MHERVHDSFLVYFFDFFSRGSLYDDVLESLSDVRRHATENLRKIREKSQTLNGKTPD